MITRFTEYIVESRKSIDELEILTPDQLGLLLIAEITKDSPDVQFIQDLLNVGCKADVRDNSTNTALHYAARLGHLEVAAKLLHSGADVNARNSHGTTPLFYAASRSNSKIELVEFLVSKGGDINIINADGWGPLLIAILAKNIDMIKFLIAIGARVNIENSDGETPWDRASNEIREAIPELNPNK